MGKKLLKPQIDFLKEQTRNLPAEGFQAVLNYYGIAADRRRSILCVLHDDRNRGNCYINPDGRAAYCYRCCKRIDGVDVVQKKEGLDYPRAMEFLWTRILGNSLPDADDRRSDMPPLTYDELKFIGLEACYGGTVLLPNNKCGKTEDVPGKRYEIKDPDGGCVVADESSFPSFGRLYGSNRKFACYLMNAKADETIRRYESLIRDLGDPSTEAGSLIKTQEELLEFRGLAEERLKKARAVKSKLKRSP